MSNFVQSIDAERPHTLLTKNTLVAGSLEYRYDDTGEVITCPNIWYNQVWQERVDFVRFEARRMDEAADRFEKYPPLGTSPGAIARGAARFRAQAKRIRSEASRMAAAGTSTHPVLASRMQLAYTIEP